MRALRTAGIAVAAVVSVSIVTAPALRTRENQVRAGPARSTDPPARMSTRESADEQLNVPAPPVTSSLWSSWSVDASLMQMSPATQLMSTVG